MLELAQQLDALIATGLGIDENNDRYYLRRWNRLHNECTRLLLLLLNLLAFLGLLLALATATADSTSGTVSTTCGDVFVAHTDGGLEVALVR